MSPKTLIGVCFVHNVYNRNMLMNDIKSIEGSSKELAEIASGSVIITIYVIQIPSEGSRLAERAYNQNLYFQGLMEMDRLLVLTPVSAVRRARSIQSILKAKKSR
jgi:hypothetical protein